MQNEHETSEQRRKRLQKAKQHTDKLEQGHLNDRPEPLSKRVTSEALGGLPPMDLIK